VQVLMLAREVKRLKLGNIALAPERANASSPLDTCQKYGLVQITV
jgi:hypothetical protein